VIRRLSATAVLEAVHTDFPEGVERRLLLDFMAQRYLPLRSHRGAKGRLARIISF
jgi:hypothetical protein